MKPFVSSKGRQFCGKCFQFLSNHERNLPSVCTRPGCNEKVDRETLKGDKLAWQLIKWGLNEQKKHAA